MIKSSNHSTKYMNSNKAIKYHEFIREYQETVVWFVDNIWNKLDERTLYLPKYVKTKDFYPENTKLSQRAIKSASTQAIGIINSAISKSKKILYINTKHNKNIPIKSFSKPKPNLSKIRAELNSTCVDFKHDKSLEFYGFLQLKSIGKYYGKIRIPIKCHRHSIKLSNNGHLMTSFLFGHTFIDFRWSFENSKIKQNGEVMGIDQGIKKVISCSNGFSTIKDKHGHDLTSILYKLSRKIKGSKSFIRTQKHRNNFINWSINQLDLSNIKEIRLEKIKNIRFRKKSSRFLSHFTNTIIRDKIVDICLVNGVRFTEIDNKYRSQRCSNCGFTHKHNRSNENFNCKGCNYTIDADLNASKNILIDIIKIPDYVWENKENHKNGFYWNPDSIYSCQEFAVPDVKKVT